MKKNILFAILLALSLAVKFYNTPNAAAAEGDIASSAQSAIVMECATNRVLFQKNAYRKLPMASTTKILTALTVLNRCDTDAIVTIPKQACGIEGSSIYLREGEKLSVLHLLYGLMLRSGNDCAVALALHAAGSCARFAEMMNNEAESCGALNSNFVNPHGLHHPDHYTTAYDLALISSAAMKNPVFREIVGTRRIEIPCSAGGGRILYNKNKMLGSYQGATGIKTGFTRNAGRCLVSSAVRDDMELICVVLNCGPMWEVSKRCMDYVFSSCKMENILPSYKYWGEIEIRGRDFKAGYYTKESFSYPLRFGEREKISVRTELPQFLKPPFKKDEKIGKIKYYYDNNLIFSANIYTINGAERISYLNALKKIISEY